MNPVIAGLLHSNLTAFIFPNCYLSITNIMKYTDQERRNALDSRVRIDSKEYYSKIDFAIITGKYPSAISKLIHQGNKFRKLKAIKLGSYIYVMASELIDFPHCPTGKAGQGDNVKPYYYDSRGNVIPTVI